jgi:hypothetical protein
MTTIKSAIVFASVLAMLSLSSPVQAIPVNLNDFSATDAVSVSPDGNFARFIEDPNGGPSLLQNDPGSGDLALFFASAGAKISFNYTFSPETFLSGDRFRASVIDPINHGVLLDQFFPNSLTPLTQFEFDLGALTSQIVGLQFDLISFNFPGAIQAFGDVATIQDLEFIPPASVVSEPNSAWLLTVTALLLYIRRKRWKSPS